jgi:hypothetical protein
MPHHTRHPTSEVGTSLSSFDAFSNEINLPHTSAALFFKLPKSRIWQVVTTIEELDLLKIMMKKRGNQIGAKDNAKRYNHRYHNGVYNHHQEHTHVQIWILDLP